MSIIVCGCIHTGVHHQCLVNMVKQRPVKPGQTCTAGVVGEELQKAVDERSLPPWIWFMWIPQLLTSLTRPETHRVKPILKQLAEVRGHIWSNMVKV